MLSEKGSIKTAAIPVAGALDLYRKKIKLISLIMLIVGAVGLIAYIVSSTAVEIKYNKEYHLFNIMLIFAVPFTLGLIGYITVIRLHKREEKEGLISSCEFYADCFFHLPHKLQPLAEEKIGYADAVLKRENEKYGYIYVFSRGIFLVFSKEDLTCGELNAIRKNFRQPIPDGEDIAQIENYKNKEESTRF